jgi:WD40 repeat protein
VFRVVRFTPDNLTLLTVAEPQMSVDVRRMVVQRWTFEGQMLSRSAGTFRGIDARIPDLTADGKYLAGGNAGNPGVWDVENNQQRTLPIKVEERAYCVVLAPDRKSVLTGHHDGTLRLWNAADGKVLAAIQAHGRTEPVYQVRVSADGKLFATRMNEGIKLFDWAALGRPLDIPPVVRVDPPKPPPATDPPKPPPANAKLTSRRVCPLPQAELTGIALSADGKTIAAATRDGVVLWDTTNEKEIGRFDDKRPFQRPIQFSRDGKWLFHLTSDTKSPVCVRSSADGKEQTRLEHGGFLAFHPFAVSPDSKTLATVCTNSIILWEMPTGQRRDLVSKSPVHFSAGSFTADGKKLRTAGSRPGAVKGTLELVTQLWDVATGKELESRVLTAGKSVQGPVISPDGRFFAFAPPQAPEIPLTDMDAPERPPALSGKPKNVEKVAFSPDSRSLATLGRDGKVIVWDVAGGDAVAEVQVRIVPSRWAFLAFSADGKFLAVTTAEGIVLCELSKPVR